MLDNFVCNLQSLYKVKFFSPMSGKVFPVDDTTLATVICTTIAEDKRLAVISNLFL